MQAELVQSKIHTDTGVRVLRVHSLITIPRVRMSFEVVGESIFYLDSLGWRVQVEIDDVIAFLKSWMHMRRKEFLKSRCR